mgnify:CR=1 FL=1
MAHDVSVFIDESIAIVTPESRSARVWIDEHVVGDLNEEPLQWIGGGLVVEPRYLDALVAGMKAAGLGVRRW